VLDLEGRRLERFREPRPDGYGRIETVPPEAEIEPQALPGVRLRLSEVPGQARREPRPRPRRSPFVTHRAQP
jgi:Uma2 family endonuclease